MEKTTLPSSLAAEQCIIASVASGAADFAELADIICAEHFSHPSLAAGWRWMEEIFHANKKPTLFALADTYSRSPEYPGFKDAMKGIRPEYGDTALEHAHRLRDQSHFRRLVATIGQLHAAAATASTYGDVRNAVEGLLMDAACDHRVTGVRSAREIVKAIHEQIKNPKLAAIHRTGFPVLDSMLRGGLRSKQLVVVAGSTGGGKTALALNMIVQAAQDGTPVGVFSLEMSAEDMLMRCILSESAVEGGGADEKIAGLPIHVSDSPDQTSRGIYAQMRILKAKHNIGIFVIDYLQLLGDETTSRENRERVVAGMSRRMKIAAKQLDVTIIALSQVNGDGELRESRAIEQDADSVLQILTDGEDYWLRVCKNRAGKKHGPMCLLKGSKDANDRGIPLRFSGEHFRFREVP